MNIHDSFDLNSEEPLEPGDISIPYEANPAAIFAYQRVGYFRNALRKFSRMMDTDFYAHPPAPDVAASYHYLNSASLPNPVTSIREEARRIFELWTNGELTAERKQEILFDARHEAAALVNLKDERGVVLCRNASEALSYFLWLSGIMEKKQGWPLVLSTDVENPSIQRQIFIIKDHSNIDRKDTITTYPEFASQRPLGYVPPQPQATGLRWGHFAVARETQEESLNRLEDFIKEESPKVLILSHVLRTTGRELPIADWIQKARAWKQEHCPRDPELFVCVDGAQALGNIPIDFTLLDCDMYVGCSQKALQGETAGLLFVNPEHPRIQKGLERIRVLKPETQVILRGMFHPDLHVDANVDDDISYPDIAGFIANIRRLQDLGLISGNDVSGLSAYRLQLKNQCREGLEEIRRQTGCNIQVLDDEGGTSFILAFRVGLDPFEMHGGWDRGFGSNPEEIFEPGAMHSQPPPAESWGKSMAEELHQQGVGIAFLRRGNTFRLSFSDQTISSDIDAFLHAFATILPTVK